MGNSDAVDWRGLNRPNWEDRVPVHLASEFYDLDGFLAGASSQPQVEDYPYPYPYPYPYTYPYTDGPALEHTRSVEFQHQLGQVVTALADAGLRIDFLDERDFDVFRRFESLERQGDLYRFPAGRPRVPLMFSLRATSPA